MDFIADALIKLNNYKKSHYQMNISEGIITEGVHYDKKAAEMLANSGRFDATDSWEIIKTVKNKITSFHGASDYINKYLKGIARLILEETSGDVSSAEEFINNSKDIFNDYLRYVRDVRPKLNNEKEMVAFDNTFINDMSFSQVQEKAKAYIDQQDSDSDKKLSQFQTHDNGYTLVPITSYDEMHKMFGGQWTGAGEGGFSGDGQHGTGWCHTNSKRTYDNWVENGANIFFVLAKNGWKEIPFNKDTNKKYQGKDEYGNSLIAILVKAATGKLLQSTLRCNHEGIKKDADNQYSSYAELSEITGFDVKKAVLEHLGKIVDMTGLIIQEAFEETFGSHDNYLNTSELVHNYGQIFFQKYENSLFKCDILIPVEQNAHRLLDYCIGNYVKTSEHMSFTYRRRSPYIYHFDISFFIFVPEEMEKALSTVQEQMNNVLIFTTKTLVSIEDNPDFTRRFNIIKKVSKKWGKTAPIITSNGPDRFFVCVTFKPYVVLKSLEEEDIWLSLQSKRFTVHTDDFGDIQFTCMPDNHGEDDFFAYFYGGHLHTEAECEFDLNSAESKNEAKVDSWYKEVVDICNRFVHKKLEFPDAELCFE